MKKSIAVLFSTARRIGLGVIALGLFASLQPALAHRFQDKPKQPKLGPPPVLKLAPIQHFKLSNGMGVTLIEKHEVPLVQVEVIIRAGAAMEPEGKGGLSSLTAAMLEEGAGTRNSLEFADAIDYLGASINAYSSTHTSGVTLHATVLGCALTVDDTIWFGKSTARW